MKQLTLKVEGMSYLEEKQVNVSFEEDKTSIENIRETILDLGYDIIELRGS